MKYGVFFDDGSFCDFLESFPTKELADAYRVQSIEGEGWELDDPYAEQYVIKEIIG